MSDCQGITGFNLVLLAMMPNRLTSLTIALAAALTSAVGCGASVIPNTDVPDTSENRDVLKFVEQYRKAVEANDVGKLLKMASADYYDDSGTPNADDDVDYERLREKLAKWDERLNKARYEVRYRKVHFLGDKVFVDYTYTGSFRLASSGDEGDASEDEERAVRRLDDNRLTLMQKDGGYVILSGM